MTRVNYKRKYFKNIDDKILQTNPTGGGTYQVKDKPPLKKRKKGAQTCSQVAKGSDEEVIHPTDEDDADKLDVNEDTRNKIIDDILRKILREREKSRQFDNPARVSQNVSPKANDFWYGEIITEAEKPSASSLLTVAVPTPYTTEEHHSFPALPPSMEFKGNNSNDDDQRRKEIDGACHGPRTPHKTTMSPRQSLTPED